MVPPASYYTCVCMCEYIYTQGTRTGVGREETKGFKKGLGRAIEHVRKLEGRMGAEGTVRSGDRERRRWEECMKMPKGKPLFCKLI